MKHKLDVWVSSKSVANCCRFLSVVRKAATIIKTQRGHKDLVKNTIDLFYCKGNARLSLVCGQIQLNGQYTLSFYIWRYSVYILEATKPASPASPACTLRSNMTCSSEHRPARVIFKVMVWKATSLVTSSWIWWNEAKQKLLSLERNERCLKAAGQDLLVMVVTRCAVFWSAYRFRSSCTCASLHLSFSLSPHRFLPLISPRPLSFLSSFLPPSFLFLPPLLFLPPSLSPSFGHFS